MNLNLDNMSRVYDDLTNRQSELNRERKTSASDKLKEIDDEQNLINVAMKGLIKLIDYHKYPELRKKQKRRAK